MLHLLQRVCVKDGTQNNENWEKSECTSAAFEHRRNSAFFSARFRHVRNIDLMERKQVLQLYLVGVPTRAFLAFSSCTRQNCVGCYIRIFFVLRLESEEYRSGCATSHLSADSATCKFKLRGLSTWICRYPQGGSNLLIYYKINGIRRNETKSPSIFLLISASPISIP
jgi:hypothetical protein